MTPISGYVQLPTPVDPYSGNFTNPGAEPRAARPARPAYLGARDAERAPPPRPVGVAGAGSLVTFTTISIDPPWPENGGGKIRRGANKHYVTMPVARIAPTILQSGVFNPADNAHLWCWVTNNYLADGLRLIDQLGFRYVNNIPWIKLVKDAPKALLDALNAGLPFPDALRKMSNNGIGQYFLGSHELLLFAVRGKGYDACTQNPDGSRRGGIYGPIYAPLGEHSEKPQEAFDFIQARSNGPYLEMFARKPRPGWTTWGTHERSSS